MKRLVLVLAGLLLLAGCATSKYQKFKRDSHLYVRHVTYDFCLTKLGKPTSLKSGNQEFVAVWQRSRYKMTDVGKLVRGKKEGERLELRFNKHTKVLTGCSYQRW